MMQEFVGLAVYLMKCNTLMLQRMRFTVIHPATTLGRILALRSSSMEKIAKKCAILHKFNIYTAMKRSVVKAAQMWQR